ncbi:MAG: helix-turn-helix domain-containing protein [Bacteroidetes bacterium]|nr:helix-turn-helix domain-containing protein [Bacteroidota bacterium]
MVDRIALLLKSKNITASQFADEIGVQRSSISHVLSGRNKPSLEFIQKILKRYSEINPDWLLFGKGPMNMEFNLFSDTNESVPLKEELISKALQKQETLLRSVPEEKIEVQEIFQPVSEMLAEKQEMQQPVYNVQPVQQTPPVAPPEAKEPEQTAKPAVVQPSVEKQIEKILVFFNNKTFREYAPE